MLGGDPTAGEGLTLQPASHPAGANQSSPDEGNGFVPILWAELGPFSLGNQLEASRAGAMRRAPSVLLPLGTQEVEGHHLVPHRKHAKENLLLRFCAPQEAQKSG